MQISVTHDVERAARQLDQLGLGQLRFATARALTMTAADAQKQVRAEMPGKFTIRRPWVLQGVRTERATKQNLTAWVYHKDAYMPRQETGGIKRGKPGGGNFSSSDLPVTAGRRVRSASGRVAVPTQQVLRGKSDIIRKSDLPKGLGPKAFVIDKGDGTQLLARRFAKGKRAGLRVLYVLKPQTYVKPRWGFAQTVERVARARFYTNLETALAQAIQTSR